MEYGDIAIIGMSGCFPKAENIEQFRFNLEKKRDCVGTIPEKRKKLLGFDGKQYMECGYLEHIEYFDEEFFGISGKEADYMSPEQKIILELAAEAILNAGYSLKEFEGTNCGVFLSSSENEYEGLLSRQTGPTRLGSLRSILSGRVAYQFDLRGPNVMYDTGCSSSLVALHEACVKLMTSEIDYALVGGISISLNIPEIQNGDYDVLGLCSNSFRSKSFDADADGVAIGEGGGCILLKRQAKAMEDKDEILATIHHGAINGDGKRSTSVTMPSVDGQKEVMLSAWKNMNLENLTDIEAHGIGTSIGDSIEANSIIANLEVMGIEHKVRLSSVKSNIGHLGYSAGISSIIKAVLELKNNITYPIVHYQKANPLIAFEKSMLEPVTDAVYWQPDSVRAVGIDSFGLGGTNAHVVLEKYIEKEKREEEELAFPILKISARSEASFHGYVERLRDYIEQEHVDLNSLIYTLNTGRDDYEKRMAFVVRDYEDLLDKLEMMSAYKKAKKYKIVFVMKLEEKQQVKEDVLKKGLPGIGLLDRGISAETDIDYKLAMYQFCTEIGIKPDLVLADSQCSTMIQYAKGKADLNQLKKEIQKPMDGDYTKVLQLIQNLDEKDNYFILDFGSSKQLTTAHFGSHIKIFELNAIQSFYKFLTVYYNNGYQLNWGKLYAGQVYQKVTLPGYCFQKTEHWAQIKPRESQELTSKERLEAVKTEEPTSNQMLESIMKTLQDIWKELFGFGGEIDIDEDFFDLGGNSLLIQKMSILINNQFQIEFDAYEVYENETIEKLSKKIIETMDIQQ
ncbi:type I polyketide synthase [[Clostridium] polysaccharolyticum]|uniref:Phosphopantetheine attachment site n=1 Tax=[Clostridium] polysaccharolyticum TaxID=29364 RepID=A0A1I0AEE9_9FIRM|nr:type I polyketide synthase [[Clostridium] polysaccharolyticum]SES92583.1 Phosphopantetheine attachment site [[Clostridium] polysaccharolyticum]